MKTHKNFQSLMNELEYAAAGIKAMGWMIAATMGQNDGLGDIAMGVNHIMDTQGDQIDALREAIDAEYVKLNDADNRRMAAEEAGANASDNVKNLRSSIIADKIKEGFDPGEIANALNLKKATVEKVISQLLGQSVSKEHVDQAVNS